MRGTLLLLVAALVLTGCSATAGAPAAPPMGTAERTDPTPTSVVTSAGGVTVAQPDPVATWWQAHPEDLAAGDLASLWSLPLYRTDPLGRAVPALATAARVVAADADWTVEVTLAPGEWSDGTPVTAADVVATAEALAEARPAAWAAWEGAQAVDDHTVQLGFDRPFAGWAALLSGAPGVLPAHVLTEEGLGAYAQHLPVTGGWFHLTAREPGVRTTFTALATSPLGAPALEEVEVLVVPSHDTALGMLDAGTVELVLGHVVVDPAARRAGLAGLVGASPLGGTRFELVWDPSGRADTGVRAAAARRLDPGPFVDGLLRDVGRRPGGLLPALEPLPVTAAASGSGEVAVQVVRTVGGVGLLARRLQVDLRTAGVRTALVRLDPPEHLEPPIDVDGRFRVVRVGPERSMATVLAELGFDPQPGLVADAAGPSPVDPMAAGVPASDAMTPILHLLGEDPRLLPVAEVGVTHVWHPDRITGVEPSAWPGIGFWNAGAWRLPAGD